MSSATKPQPTQTASALASSRARSSSAWSRYGPALSVGMKSDSCYAATVLGIQFANRPNQAYRRLTSIDHCNSAGKPDVGVNHSLSVCARLVPKNSNRRLLFGPE
jgi:hypothetical protein